LRDGVDRDSHSLARGPPGAILLSGRDAVGKPRRC
jgi:hypothetical protein